MALRLDDISQRNKTFFTERRKNCGIGRYPAFYGAWLNRVEKGGEPDRRRRSGLNKPGVKQIFSTLAGFSPAFVLEVCGGFGYCQPITENSTYSKKVRHAFLPC
jgi:hypothetical protein